MNILRSNEKMSTKKVIILGQSREKWAAFFISKYNTEVGRNIQIMIALVSASFRAHPTINMLQNSLGK